MGIPERSRLPGVEYKFLFVMDSITQDILANNLLNIGLKFIEDSINDSGTVLVHCEVGMSRSIVFVVAYLMRRYQWSVEKALLHVRTARPIAHPNDGFIKQLQVFQSTGCKADVTTLAHSNHYRRWCSLNGIVPVADLASLPSVEDSAEPSASNAEYRCRKCRKPLFYEEHVIKHGKSSSQSRMNNAQNEINLDDPLVDECEFGVLLTPMKWMDLGSYEGKILCPSCQEKLGHYVWGGRLCMGVDGKKCGTPVRPWVHIHKGKVDVKFLFTGNDGEENVNGPMFVRPPVPRIVEPEPEPECEIQSTKQMDAEGNDDEKRFEKMERNSANKITERSNSVRLNATFSVIH